MKLAVAKHIKEFCAGGGFYLPCALVRIVLILH